MIYFLIYIAGAAIYNLFLIRWMNEYINDPEEDKEFDELRLIRTEEEIQKMKKNVFKGTAFVLSIIWPMSVIIDLYLYLRARKNES